MDSSKGKDTISRQDTVPAVHPDTDALLGDLKRMIDEARSAVAVAVNAGLTMLYWRIGKRIQDDILKSERAGYGDQIVSTLSRQSSWSHSRELSMT